MDEIVSDFVFSGDTLNINEAIYGDDSEYCCEATNEAGSITDCITITLMSKCIVYSKILTIHYYN